MRKELIKDKTISTILDNKQEYVNKNLELIKKIEVLQKEYDKNTGLLAREDDKLRTKVKKIMPVLGEYEQVSRVYNDKGQWYFEIADRMEEFKARFING